MKKSFTLIEIIIVVGILGMVFPLLFSIVFSIVRQQTKLTRVSLIKREGDSLVNHVKRKIRSNAYKIYNAATPFTTVNEQCSADNSSYSSDSELYLSNTDTDWFYYGYDNNTIYYNDNALGELTRITTSNVKISNFEISCFRQSIFAPAVIKLSFDICYKGTALDCNTTLGEEIATLYFQTYIALRNY